LSFLGKEAREAQSKGSINSGGVFQKGDHMIVEVHGRDDKRFGGWAFFEFGNGKQAQAPLQPSPSPMSCYTCHREHGAVDTTFVQFYPTLRTVK